MIMNLSKVFLAFPLLISLEGLNQNEVPTNTQGEVLTQSYSPSYNAQGAIAISHKFNNKWLSEDSFFADASFTYWYLSEEGLKIATNAVLNGSTLNYSTNTHSHFPTFNYQPGFKVGIGSIYANEWVSRIEYTWASASSDGKGMTSSPGGNLPAGSSTVSSGSPVFVVDDWFLQGSSSGQALAASSISSNWKLHMNIVDITCGRPWYQGKNVIISPMGGLELAFISQQMNVALTEVPLQLSPLPFQPIHSRNKLNSWAVGFIGGGECKTLLPWNLYLQGSGSISLLYTTYTTIKHSEDIASTAFNPGPYKASYKNYHAVRPNAIVDMGLGWGKYFCHNACYVDLSANYEFSIYWAQNMMRKLLDDVLTGTSAAPADLFIQGLTITGSLHF